MFFLKFFSGGGFALRPLKQSLLTCINLKYRNISSSAVKMGKLDNKVAIVTASTDGIGYAIAKKLAQEGASVVVSSRKEQNVQSAVNKLKDLGLKNIIGVVCHVGKAEDRKILYDEAITKFGGIDILVSNAAVNPVVGYVLQCPESSWDKIFEINVKAAFLLSKEVAPFIKKRGGGSIVYISSIAGITPIQLLGAYSVSKTALLGLTKAAAQELSHDNIRVNCVAPGIVRTKFASALLEDEETVKLEESKILLNRIAEPDDISGTVAFLCSDDAKYITAETISVTGGFNLRL